jgi:hypothetical protein
VFQTAWLYGYDAGRELTAGQQDSKQQGRGP